VREPVKQSGENEGPNCSTKVGSCGMHHGQYPSLRVQRFAAAVPRFAIVIVSPRFLNLRPFRHACGVCSNPRGGLNDSP
jgi:hypothetical protein